MTFAEHQAQALKVPLSLRNDQDRVDLPVRGLQEEAGKIGALLTTAFSSGKLALTSAQTEELRQRLGDVLWSAACICGETGLALEDVAARGVAQLAARAKDLDPDRR